MSKLTSLKKEIELQRKRLDILVTSEDISKVKYNQQIYEYSIKLDLLIEEYIDMVEKEKINNIKQCV